MITCEIFAPVRSQFGQCEVGMILDIHIHEYHAECEVSMILDIQHLCIFLVSLLRKNMMLPLYVQASMHICSYACMLVSCCQYYANFTLPKKPLFHNNGQIFEELLSLHVNLCQEVVIHN